MAIHIRTGVLCFRVLSCLTVQGAFAQGRGDASGRSGDMDSLMQQIGVTPEQQKQLEDQRKEHMQEYQAIRNAVQEKERELRSALKDPNVDPAEIQRLKRELLQLQEKNINQKIEGTMRMREVLTEDQFNTLTDKIDARRKNRKGGRRR